MTLSLPQGPALLVPLVAFATLVAGCAGASSTAGVSTSAPPSAEPPVVSVDTGSVAGTVVDEELLPLAGVTVSLVETGARTSTDVSGRFTINDIQPGSFRIFFQQLGFETVARKVDVVAGDVTTVNATLKPMAVSSEPFTETTPRVWLIHVDHDYVQQVLNIGNVNNSVLNDLRCSPCQSVIHLTPKPQAALVEADWQPGPGPVNTQAYSEYYRNWTDTTAGTRVCFAGFPAPRTSFHWGAPCVAHLKTTAFFKMYIMGGFTAPSFEQRVNTWLSFSYNQDFPEDFTALPPP